MIMMAGLIGLGFIAPWWVSVIWIVSVTYAAQLKTSHAIFTGGLVMGFVWLIAAMFFSRTDPNHIISKTANLLGGFSSGQFFSVIVVLGFVTGILAGWFGSALGQFVRLKSAQSTFVK